MATDNTPPRLRLIVTIAIIMVITLVGFDFVFRGYFGFMTDEAKHEKTAPKTDLIAQVLAEQSAFAGAKIPVDQAMGQIAKGSRPDLIDPKPSDDLAPMTGWSKLPKQVPVAAPMGADPQTATTGGAGADITDAGAAMTDAGLAAPGRAGTRPPGHP